MFSFAFVSKPKLYQRQSSQGLFKAFMRFVFRRFVIWVLRGFTVRFGGFDLIGCCIGRDEPEKLILLGVRGLSS